MFCPSCGTKNNYYHRFCFHCGAKLTLDDVQRVDNTADIPDDDTIKLTDEDLTPHPKLIIRDILPDNPKAQEKSPEKFPNKDSSKFIEDIEDDDYEDEDEDEEDEYFDFNNQIPLRRYTKEPTADTLQTLIKICVSVVLIALIGFLAYIGYDQLIKRPGQADPVIKRIDFDYTVEEIEIEGQKARNIVILTKTGEIVELFGNTLPITDGRAEMTILDSEFNINEYETVNEDLIVTLDIIVKADDYPNRREELKFRVPVLTAPLTIISPSTREAVVDGNSYQLVLQVALGSEVYIDDNNYSHLVDENGQLSVNLEVPQESEIRYSLRVSARGYEDTLDEILLKRRQMEFPLTVKQPVPIKASEDQWVEVTGNTHPEAALTTNLETREAPTVDPDTGDFKLYVKAVRSGYTPFKLTASLEGKEDSVLELVIERPVDEAVYTSTAWAAVYEDLKAYPNLHVGMAYAFVGTISEIDSSGTKSTLTVNIAKEGEGDQPIIVDYWGTFNYSIGQKVKLFGNHWGNKNGVPYILAKHLYKQR